MDVADVIAMSPPTAESGLDKIPWNDPDFSRRMLQEHLSQNHALASRPFAKIDRHVRFIHDTVLLGRPSRILDLGCGPGLYTGRLTHMGHRCVGIDFSPASIEYARTHGSADYIEADLRDVALPGGFDLAMILFGEANMFAPDVLRRVLARVAQSCHKGALLVLELHRFETVRSMGVQPNSWSRHASGLFSEGPHLILNEHVWDDERAVAMTRHIVLQSSGKAEAYGSSTQAYTCDGLDRLIADAGFRREATYPSLLGTQDSEEPAFEVVVAVRPDSC